MYYLFLAAFIAAGDQLFKYWITKNIELGGELPLLPGFMHLTHVRNTGAAFSMMTGMRWVLLAVSLVCMAGIVVYLFKTKLGIPAKLAIAAVLGGAFGNAVDRAFTGYVVDMFEVEFVRYAVFNVADCFIVAGGVLFCILCIFAPVGDKAKSGKKAAAPVGVVTSEARLPEKPRRMPELERLFPSGQEELSETAILEEYDLQRRMNGEAKNGDDKAP